MILNKCSQESCDSPLPSLRDTSPKSDNAHYESAFKLFRCRIWGRQEGAGEGQCAARAARTNIEVGRMHQHAGGSY